MKKVICYPFVGDSVGGSHISAIELIRGIDCSRYRPIIILHEEGPLAEYLRKQALEYLYFPLDTYAGATPNLISIAIAALRAIPKLRKFMRCEKVNLVHGNDLRINLSWVLACRISGIPFVWHQRTQTFSRSCLWRVIPWIADHCIAISKTTALPLGEASTRLSVIDNPFLVKELRSRDILRQALVEEAGVDKSAYIIGCVGRLTEMKRPEVCVKLLGELSRRGCNLNLFFFGHGASSIITRLEMLANKYDLRDKMHFMGFRYPIENYIAGLDILVAPSQREGFGRTLIEAMLIGTPVLASDIDAHRETVIPGVNGLMAPPGDINIFADQALRLLRDSSLAKRIGDKAREMAQMRFSARRHVIEVQSVYKTLLVESL